MQRSCFVTKTYISILITVLSTFMTPCFAQTVQGSIAGRVTNTTNQQISGASVSVVEEDTNQSRTAKTDAAGSFLVALLPAGRYRVEVDANGYRTTQRVITLLVNQQANLDLAMVAGQRGERIEVTGEYALLNTESAAISTVVANREVVNLPLDGRKIYELALLAPGVVPAAQGSAGSARGDFIFNVNGAREDSNNFLLDGVFNNDPKLNGFAVTPPVDGVREFEVLTNSYDAAFGRNSGGQINVLLKSGANQIHGTAYEFLRNRVLDGANYFAPKDASPSNIRNQFGGSLGGPIARNRTFFFADYEGQRIREGITRTSNVPTALERAGNFSQSGLSLIPIDLFTQAPFPNFIIPQNRMSRIGLAIAALYPLPNRSVPGQNYVSSPNQVDRDDQFDTRLDHKLSASSELAFHYSFGDRDFYEPFGAGSSAAAVPGFGNNIPRRAQNAMLGETHVFTPALVNELRLGFNRVSLSVNQQNQTNNLNQAVGLPVISKNARDTGLTQIGLAGFSTLGDELNNPQRQSATTYQVVDNLSWVRGRHLVKVGGEFRHQRQNSFADVLSRGLIQFTGFTGNALAEMLQSVPSYSTVARLDNPQHLRSSTSAFYSQDTFRVNSNLTLTLGVRYEFNAPPSDPQNRASIFDPASRSILPVGKNGIPSAGYFSDKNNFAPRFGLAWTPGQARMTTVRLGYGMYYDQSPSAPGQGLFFSPPYFKSQLFIQTAQVPLFLENIFPANYPIFIPNSAFTFQRNLRTPYTQQWSLSVQRQVGKSSVAEISYIGVKGSKLIANRDINQPSPSVRQPNLRPLPQFSDIDAYESRGNSNYNAMQAKFTRRFHQGLSALASYTWAKSIDDVSGFFSSTGDPNFPQDSNNARAERALSNFDVRHRFTLGYSYDLPFKSKNAALRGWQTNGVWAFQTGTPFTVTLPPGTDNSNTGIPSIGFGVVNRPNVVAGASLSDRTPEKWFNTAAFTKPAFGSFGNAGRNLLEGPGSGTVNVSVIKNTAIKEGLTLQFRAEIFNLLDRANFDLPQAYLGLPGFARIASAGSPRRVQFGLKLLF